MDLNINKLAEHVKDADAFHLPFERVIPVPQPFEAIGIPLHVTKFMVLELLAAVALIAVFVPLARKIATGKPPKGALWNMLETMVFFVRDEMVRPAIGHHEADRFVPFILSLFFFILGCNLLGMIPTLGSPTASINVTAPLAVISFLVCIGAGMKKFGALKFWLGLCPHMDLPFALKIFLVPMILALEILGLCIKHTILAVRLLANMFAGHLVLAVIVGFIPATASMLIWYGVTPASILGATALNLLELFVAFLQAYLFAFLTALFIGMSVHQH